jgi:DNA-binding MarR family transcriptional regulator
MDNQIQVVDLREKYFRVTNHIFEEDLDIYEIGVYSVLCRYGNNDSTESFPSISKIQKMLKVSRPKIVKTLKSLTDKGIVHKRSGNKGFSNRYYLLSLPSKRELLVNMINQTSKPDLPEVVNEVNSIKTNTKKTNIKKLTYGDNGNVKLTENEYKKLLDKYNNPRLIDKINDLSHFMASTGKVYKSHYYTIINWFRMEAKRNTPTAKTNKYTHLLNRAKIPPELHAQATEIIIAENLRDGQIVSSIWDLMRARGIV